jgi:SAM-dependent methyltransferase
VNIRDFNKEAWDRLVDKKNRWTRSVTSAEIAQARKGHWSLLLTPTKPVPAAWYPELRGLRVLCLAGAGGQQGPVLSAAGAIVTVFDNSPKQLEQDRMVAQREDLKLKTVEGDMKDLSCFADESFDFIFHPCSNCFAEAIRPVWKEAFRVLRHRGTMLSGFANPLIYLFDPALEKQNVLQLRYKMPYSDQASLTPEERDRYYPGEPLTFGHSLEDQIGGQVDAGFHIVGFYEDDWGGNQCIDQYLKGFIATRALKP